MDEKLLDDKYFLINIKDLKFKYNKKQPHYDIEIDKLQIPGNQIISLLGPSGSGKTTLLNLLLGFLKPTSGSLSIRNNPKPHEIAYIMQEGSIYENVSVFDNIFLSAKNKESWVDSVRMKYFDEYFSEHLNYDLVQKYLYWANSALSKKLSRWEKKKRYLKLLWAILTDKSTKGKFKIFKDLTRKSLFKKELNEISKKLGIDGLIHKNVNELSGGQKQRVSFAKGIVKRTSLILMDEPFSALDAKIKESTIEWLLQIKKEFNLSIVVVTHDQHDALKISDQIILMDKGKIQQFSSGEQMYDNPNNLFVAKFIGSPEINFIEEKNGYSYYIRQNKVKMNPVKNGKYKVVDKKHFGDSVHYWVEINPNNKWVVVSNDASIDIDQRVNLKYLNSDVFVFDSNGERVYAQHI
ncbi:ABC transporter ATP-binding protein [Mycoplasmopsis mucosicanis]|uniref:ABC transporter ATP-binding protein n=1 Tax=Mycoplasmopsis mucosicanis TaxID=458208 RepID=A0A507SHR3_9BACT|nr:ABC transporter ATP-binding protein [Mycoplasmopsis mucosicanis]TQC51310.1 ABC transporter ATP-binding protein [Mycoplasmopsis mucosicanis]